MIERFLSRLKDVKSAGEDKWNAKCPAHNEQNGRSLSVKWEQSSGKILTYCHGQKCSYDAIMKAVGLYEEKPKAPKKKRGITLDELATNKSLPIEFLREMGCEEGEFKGAKIVNIAYHGGRTRVRKRLKDEVINGKPVSRFTWASGEEPIRVYRPRENKQENLCIVEGESDTWTLLYHEFDAIGVPGATMTRHLVMEDIGEAKRIYLCQEPGKAGEEFVSGCRNQLAKIGFAGEVFAFSMGQLFKDPNELHKVATKEMFRNDFSVILESAKKIDMPQITQPTPKQPETAPESTQTIPDEEVRIGDFLISSKGVWYQKEIKDKNGNTKEIKYEPVFPQDVRLREIYHDITQEETQARLSWNKKELKVGTEVLIHSKNHPQLARKGIWASSTNATRIVNYFMECLKEIGDKETLAASRNGWTQYGFVLGDKLITPTETKPIEFSAVGYIPSSSGSEKEQLSALAKLSEDIQIAIKVGGSAISPLLREIGCENFVHHHWGGSGRCKTTGSVAGASLWARPKQIIEDWQTTDAGKETIYEEAGGLPVFFEESQKAFPDSVLRTIYSFANSKQAGKSEFVNGRRKRRECSESIGIFFSTGESQATANSESEGDKARILEQHKKKIVKPGYAEEIEKHVSILTKNYGHLGPKIIRKYFEKKDDIKAKFKEYTEKLRKKSSAGMQYRQIPYYAACLTGCDILRALGVNMPSAEELINSCYETMVDERPLSLAERAMEHVCSMVGANANKFERIFRTPNGMGVTESVIHEKWGYVDLEKKLVYFYPSEFKKVLDMGKFSKSASLAALKEDNLLECNKGRSDKNYRVPGGRVERFICVKYEEISFEDEVAETPDKVENTELRREATISAGGEDNKSVVTPQMKREAQKRERDLLWEEKESENHYEYE